MPAAKLGRGTFINIGKESTYGVAVTTTVSARIASETLKREQERAHMHVRKKVHKKKKEHRHTSKNKIKACTRKKRKHTRNTTKKQHGGLSRDKYKNHQESASFSDRETDQCSKKEHGNNKEKTRREKSDE